MMSFIKLFIFGACFVAIAESGCPRGGDIYAYGISNEGKIAVLNAHNNFRLLIAQGVKTPKGTNLLRMVYDDQLGEEGHTVSDQCKMVHNIAKDPRWGWVGQNLYLEWSSAFSTTQNWQKAVDAWTNEYANFIYPNGNNGGVTGHYTQVVWANSKYVGCHFIAYYDVDKPDYPYAKLYTCNYGPGGNYAGQAPYSVSTSGQQCPNLC